MDGTHRDLGLHRELWGVRPAGGEDAETEKLAVFATLPVDIAGLLAADVLRRLARPVATGPLSAQVGKNAPSEARTGIGAVGS